MNNNLYLGNLHFNEAVARDAIESYLRKYGFVVPYETTIGFHVYKQNKSLYFRYTRKTSSRPFPSLITRYIDSFNQNNYVEIIDDGLEEVTIFVTINCVEDVPSTSYQLNRNISVAVLLRILNLLNIPGQVVDDLQCQLNTTSDNDIYREYLIDTMNKVAFIFYKNTSQLYYLLTFIDANDVKLVNLQTCMEVPSCMTKCI